MQLTSTSARSSAGAGACASGDGAQLVTQLPAPGGGAVPHPDLAGAGVKQRPHSGAGAPPAPSTSALRPAIDHGSAATSAGASVLSATIPPPGSNVSVLAAPIARARSVGAVARASAAPLWGIVTLAPRKPAPGSAGTSSANSSGATGSSW